MAAVRRYDVLDTPPDGAFERLTALAAKHFDGITEAHTPTGMLGSEGLADALGDAACGAPAARIVAMVAELLEADGIDVADDAAALVIRAV